MSFNIFGSATKKDIRVGYIDPDTGYVQNISILEANKYAALNPGTMFILKTRDATRYLTLNEVNALTPDVLDVDGDVCGGIKGLRPGERAPFTPLSGTGPGGTQTGSNVNVSYDDGCRGRLFLSGGGGVGAVGSPIFGRDGSLLAIRVVSGGFGYKYPPKAKLVDSCKRGSGAVIRTIIGELPPTTEYFDQEEDFEVYDLTPDGTELSGYGLRHGVEGEVLGPWDPNLFATLAKDPIQLEINRYQDFLKQGINPFWHTRKENPLSVTFRDKTSRVLHHVSHVAWSDSPPGGDDSPTAREITSWYNARWGRVASAKEISDWIGTGLSGKQVKSGILTHSAKVAGYIPKGANLGDSFMNRYAVSPVPSSNAPGSDYAGYIATMEWEENFPYTGEYTFRGMGDNIARCYLDNELVTEARNFKVSPLPRNIVKKNIQEGVHRIKIDLYNIPIREKVIVKTPKGDPTNIKFRVTTSADFANGIKIPGLGINVSKQYKGKQLNESLNRDINYGIEYDVTTTSGGRGKIKLRTSGNNVLQMEETSDNDWQDLVCTASGGRFIKINGNKCKLIFDAPPTTTQTQSNVSGVSGSNVTSTSDTIFNTIDYINKADRKLWRTNVYGRGGFINDFGVCPFNTRQSLNDNPYAGDHVIRWNDINVPADGNYKIDVEVDDRVKLSFIKGGDRVEIEKNGFVGDSNKGTGKSTYTKFLKKGKYKVIAELYQKPGGRFAFDGDGNPNSTRVSARFVKRDGQNYLKVDGSGTAEISFRLKVDDNFRVSGVFASKVKIGRPPNDYVLLSRNTSGGNYKERETITGSDTFEAGREYLIETIGSSSGAGSRIENNGNSIGYDDDIDRGFDRNGELSITKIKNQQPSSVKGINPMALAINVQLDSAEVERISAKSWNENPMGAALTIDAPLPPIPESPIPVGEGRCPKNPIWTTRFPGGQKKWWPVNHPAWSKFTNRFALSPLPPLSTLNSDGGGGVTYSNTWPLEIPYDGFYGFKGTADNAGRILVDGREVYKLKGFKNSSPKIEKVKLNQGSHSVTVEVENFRQENTKIFKKKIFSTQDWAKKLSAGGSVDVNFKVTSSADFANSVEMKEAFSFGKSYNGAQINESTSKTLESGKVYDVIFNSNRKGGGGNKGYQISYEGLNSANESINSSDRELKFKDGSGSDTNAEFRIISSSPGVDVKFSSDGRSLNIKGSGDVTLRLKWSDSPNTAGVALKSISLGGKTWNQSGSRGEQTETIKVSGGSSGSQGNNSAIKLRNAGENVVQMEDHKDNDWQDIVVTASKGKFYDFNGNRCKYVVGGGTKAVQVSPTQKGVTYSGPEVFRYIDKRWSDFMNKNNVSPFIPPLDLPNPKLLGNKDFTWSNVDFSENGRYEFKFHADGAAILFINGVKSLESKTFRGEPITQFVDLSAGKYEVRVQLLDDSGFGTIFNTNPTGFSLRIIKDIVKVISTPPWTTNPLCASAIIIPPPCPKVIRGTGVVTDIIAEEPGNGYPTPPGGGPPVTLVLKDIIPTSPGINYGPDDLVLIDGKPLKPILGPFGTVEGVEPSDRPYYGITEYPNITMPSDTGVGFRGRPVFEPVIVPELVIPDDQLLQVTDLVGLKQTGYVNGRPYYGSTFSQEGILYAGVYETTGDLIQVYATLQESVDNQVTTRASAILRQGSDVTSNDPRLNIPNTPDNLI